MFTKELLVIDLAQPRWPWMGWRTPAATDQGTLWQIGDLASVTLGPGVCDERS